MKTILRPFASILLLCLFGISWTSRCDAQLFYDASGNLPASGASRQSMDVKSVDLDLDGDPDIVLANEFQPNNILLNDGQGVFVQAPVSGLPQRSHDSEDVAIADFDNDGDPDLIFCSEDDVTLGRTNVHEYYLNNGDGTFTEHPDYRFPDSEANAVVTADLNGDSFPDVIFGNDGKNSLFINMGDGTFNDETALRLPGIIRTTQDINLADIDNDGDLDLFAGNENGNTLLINNGQGIFEDESSVRLPPGLNIETRKVSFADVDSDGFVDIFLSNVMFIPGKNRQNRLFINNGSGYFEDVTSTHLPSDNEDTLDGIFLDVDTDGDRDLVIANVNLNVPARQKIYLNDGNGKFSDHTFQVLGNFYFGNALGVIAGDFNGDGGTDLYFCDRNTGSGNKDLLLFNAQTNSSTSPLPVSSTVKILPNPVRDRFVVEWAGPDNEPVSLLLSDTNGILLVEPGYERMGRNRIQVSLGEHDLPAAVYILQIRFREKSVSRKLYILERP